MVPVVNPGHIWEGGRPGGGLIIGNVFDYLLNLESIYYEKLIESQQWQVFLYIINDHIWI